MNPHQPPLESVGADGQDQSHLTSVKHEIPITLEHALIRSLAMLQQHNLATAEDCSQVAATVRGHWEENRGADPIDCLARLRAGGGDMLDAIVEMLSKKLAQSMRATPSRVPFASRLIPPSSLYEQFPNVTLQCRLMQVPITFAEDADVLGLASINPYFADALAYSIKEELKQANGISPVVSVVRLDYISWRKMCAKHFKE